MKTATTLERRFLSLTAQGPQCAPDPARRRPQLPIASIFATDLVDPNPSAARYAIERLAIAGSRHSAIVRWTLSYARAKPRNALLIDWAFDRVAIGMLAAPLSHAFLLAVDARDLGVKLRRPYDAGHRTPFRSGQAEEKARPLRLL
jgi:hypothetical protein